MLEGRKPIIEIGKFTEYYFLFCIELFTNCLIFFCSLLYVRRRKTVHLRQKLVRVLRQIDNARVELPPFSFSFGPRALVIDNPIYVLRRWLIVEPDFAPR